MAKGYIIGNVTVRDKEQYMKYVELDTPILKDLGGTFIVRGGQSELMEGESLERQVVVEFPSYEQALAAYNDPEYQKVADIRRGSADSNIVVVEGAE